MKAPPDHRPFSLRPDTGIFLGLLLISLLHFSYPSLCAADEDKPYVIPDLRAWNDVKLGMTVEKVEKLLGKPMKGMTPSDPEFKPEVAYGWTYGYVARKSPMLPMDLSFTVNILKGKVVMKEDPFGEVRISENGKPSVPKLMTPVDRAVFDHYPRLMDFRWYPSSGDYPMKYQIEVGVMYSSGQWNADPTNEEVTIPYHSYVHTGANAGRWRVRAVNSKGTSDWSKYSHFGFKR